MSTPAAYLGVILIWSTTPLAIKWSGEGPGYLFGAAGRMLLSALLCLALVKILRLYMPWDKNSRRTYLAASLGIYGAMLSVYWGVQFIPSGLIAVLFGLLPLVTSIMAALWLQERSLTPIKISGLLLGIAGLWIVFRSNLVLQRDTAYGIAAVLLAVLLHAASSVWIKRLGTALPAMSVAAGGLLTTIPLYGLTWLAVGQSLPAEIPLRSALSIVYLAVFGSVIGFMLYFYVLKRLPVSTTALITLVTPVTALLLGKSLNAETIPAAVWHGTACISLGLLLHQWDEGALLRFRRSRADR